MKNIQNYDEFLSENLNENILTKTLGPLLVGLFSILPSPGKAQYNNNLLNPLNPLSPLNPISPIYLFDDDDHTPKEVDKFAESLERTYRILRSLGKEEIIKDKVELQKSLDLIEKIYDEYKQGGDVQTEIDQLIKNLSTYVNEYSNEIDFGVKEVFNRISSGFDYSSDKNQLMKDYGVIYNQVEEMKSTYKITGWQMQDLSSKIAIIVIGLMVLVLLIIFILGVIF